MTDDENIDDDLRALDGDGDEANRSVPPPPKCANRTCRFRMDGSDGLCSVCRSQQAVANAAGGLRDRPAPDVGEAESGHGGAVRPVNGHELYEQVKAHLERAQGEGVLLVGFLCIAEVVTESGQGIVMLHGSPDGSPPPPRWKRLGMIEEAGVLTRQSPM